MPQVKGSLETAAGARPYFSFSMNSLIGISSGTGGSSPVDFAGRKPISRVFNLVAGKGAEWLYDRTNGQNPVAINRCWILTIRGMR